MRAQKPRRQQKPLLEEATILKWADHHRAETGDWPCRGSGPILAAPRENWRAVDHALRQGFRGLPGGTSLARLLEAERGRRNRANLPGFSHEQILAWADAHQRRTGTWPIATSGLVTDAPGETWSGVDIALWAGNRGLPGGESLARLLAARRGVRNLAALPDLTEEIILAWADAHYAGTGAWPHAGSGAIAGTDDESWRNVDASLWQGGRGLPGGYSLARLLEERRGVRNPSHLSPLDTAQILVWADAYRERAGGWPTRGSGRIAEAPGETWAAIDAALRNGHRGLPGGSSLARLLRSERGTRHLKLLAPLTTGQILAWCDAHHRRTGRWPQQSSGAIVGAPGETWGAVNQTLRSGGRGLPGGTTLAALLAEHRGVRNGKALPPLTEAQILAWAEAHFARTRRWPTHNFGPIADGPGETWMAVQQALVKGRRGLPGGSSLSRLLKAHRDGLYPTGRSVSSMEPWPVTLERTATSRTRCPRR